MREQLREIDGERRRFTARVERFGTKRAFRGPPLETVLLVDVRDASGAARADHLWMTVGERLRRLDLRPGDRVAFDGRVDAYVKGYRGRDEDHAAERPPEVDYRISRPTKLEKVGADARQAPLC